MTVVDTACKAMARTTDQLRHGVSMKEIDFKGVAAKMKAGVDELRQRMTPDKLLKYCAGSLCEDCKHKCLFVGRKDLKCGRP